MVQVPEFLFKSASSCQGTVELRRGGWKKQHKKPIRSRKQRDRKMSSLVCCFFFHYPITGWGWDKTFKCYWTAAEKNEVPCTQRKGCGRAVYFSGLRKHCANPGKSGSNYFILIQGTANCLLTLLMLPNALDTFSAAEVMVTLFAYSPRISLFIVNNNMMKSKSYILQSLYKKHMDK